MSLARQLFREFQPFFHMLEEPLTRSTPAAYYSRRNPLHSFNNHSASFRVPNHVLEESSDGKEYIIEAELPGVKKDDVDVRIGNSGRSITIQGKVIRHFGTNQSSQSAGSTNSASPTSNAEGASSDASAAVTEASSQSDAVTASSQEPTGYSESLFRRTIWLPQPVSPKGEGITAKLEDGLLKLRISKLNPEEEGGHKITLE